MAVTIIRIIDGKTYWQGLSTDTKYRASAPTTSRAAIARGSSVVPCSPIRNRRQPKET